MQILVTGATGFIGQHLVPELLKRNHTVVAVVRNPERAQKFAWFGKVKFIEADIYSEGLDVSSMVSGTAAIIHLAYPGLPNYLELFHFEKNLFNDYFFLKRLIMAGTSQVMVTGTCFEYGLQNGELSEDQPAVPINPYGIAKDSLRKFLQALQAKQNFVLQWVRLFYIYGPGQNPKSILSQLDQAIDRGESVFNMSGGEQLRDYLPIEEVADRLRKLIEYPDCAGIVNCCSGSAISIRRLVEDRIAQRRATIKLNLGHYPYPKFEPFSFWGNCSKLKRIPVQCQI